MISRISKGLIALAAFLPYAAFAATVRDLGGLIDLFYDFIKRLIPLVFAIAILAFFWGVARYIMNADNESERTKGNQMIIYSIIALFVMVSIWGIISILTGTFGVGSGSAPFLPTLPGR